MDTVLVRREFAPVQCVSLGWRHFWVQQIQVFTAVVEVKAEAAAVSGRTIHRDCKREADRTIDLTALIPTEGHTL